MNAFDRMKRLRACMRIADWKEQEPELQLNTWAILDPAEANEREMRYGGGMGDRKRPTKAWYARYAGLSAEGDTPEQAAVGLEGLVFDAILSGLDEKIAKNLDRAQELQTLRATMLGAMGRPGQ